MITFTREPLASFVDLPHTGQPLATRGPFRDSRRPPANSSTPPDLTAARHAVSVLQKFAMAIRPASASTPAQDLARCSRDLAKAKASAKPPARRPLTTEDMQRQLDHARRFTDTVAGMP